MIAVSGSSMTDIKKPHLAILALALLCYGSTRACGQRAPIDSDRETIALRRKRSKPIKCRILDNNDPRRILYVLGNGSEKHIDRARTQTPWPLLHRIKVAQWLEERESGDSETFSRQWELIELAARMYLERIAELQALHLLNTTLLDPTNPEAENYLAKARTFLGHRKHQSGGGGGTAKWGRMVGRKMIEETKYLGPANEMRLVVSENWAINSKLPIDQAVSLCFDLERLYTTIASEIGRDIGMREIVVPHLVDIFSSDSPRFSEFQPTKIPYLRHWEALSGDSRVHTFIEDDADRPYMLFQIATEAILYETMRTKKSRIQQFGSGPNPDRFSTWFEVGLGCHYASRATGPVGHVKFGPPQVDRQAAQAVFDYSRIKLPNLLGVGLRSLHERRLKSALLWSEIATFVGYLLDTDSKIPKTDEPTRTELLAHVKKTFRSAKQESSSEFDKNFGVRIETLQRPWLEWVAAQLGRDLRERRPKRLTTEDMDSLRPAGMPPSYPNRKQRGRRPSR